MISGTKCLLLPVLFPFGSSYMALEEFPVTDGKLSTAKTTTRAAKKYIIRKWHKKSN